ncbi:DUF2127 domain-containing protein [Amnibacterium sp.]|uniref:DUF2127 domain-containing protein n=1 Tax=Amnibacterium sp. TaxID=1872496 RepID=UPI002618BF09|nr:DUF2127 domain-containing protein [Amnibacterium sp.]
MVERTRETTRADGRSRRSLFDRVYGFTIALKGLDGVIELVAGLLLLLAPNAIRWGLEGGAAEAQERFTPFRGFLADELLRADQVVAAGVAVLAVVLLVHGVVKVVTVYCLLRRILAAYPWAVLVLVGLLIWQSAVLATAPSAGSAVLAALDVVVLALVAREWRVLAIERRRPVSPEERED